MKPEDLLRRIGFDFMVLSPKEHEAMCGVQVTAESPMPLTVDMVFTPTAKMRMATFRQDEDGMWVRSSR